MQKADQMNDKANEWVSRHAGLIPTTGRVLDLACGSGRHARMLAELGHTVLAVDKSFASTDSLQNHTNVELLETDLETADWPLAGVRFAGIIVVNYLYRPHLAALIDNLQDDGVLIYSTFAAGNERFGRPRNPEFLLQPDELLQVFSERLEVIAHESLTTPAPKPAVRQQICACGPLFQHP
jgi:SAM-dependent methyltransferase